MSWLAELRALVGAERVRTSPAELWPLRRDAAELGVEHGGQPAALLLPEDTAHVAAGVRIAMAAGVPIVARGAGTSLAGGAVPVEGALVIAFSRMRRIRSLDVAERIALVEAGLVNAELDAIVRNHGLRFAADPASRSASTVGGNVATNAGGLHCLGHGVTSAHVAGLEVVLADGSVAWLDEDDAPDLRALVVGGEGTLALVTAALVRLLPLPEAVALVVAGFPRLEQAGEAAERLVLAVDGLVALELIDTPMLAAAERIAPGLWPASAEAALLIEVEALADGIEAAIADIHELITDVGGRAVTAAGETVRARVWQARSASFAALGRLRPNQLTHDFAVPRDRLVATLRATTAIAARHDLMLSTVAHLGDGNLHPRLHYDTREPGADARVAAASNEILSAVLESGGTLSGEHGIGMEKLADLARMLGRGELDLLGRVRRAFDPSGLLNPGKAAPGDGS